MQYRGPSLVNILNLIRLYYQARMKTIYKNVHILTFFGVFEPTKQHQCIQT